MPPTIYSDEPHLIKPIGPNYRLWATLAAIVVLIGLIISIPLYQRWMDHEAHEAERGQYQGAVYEVPIAGSPQKIELAWAGEHLAIAMDALPAPDASVRVKGEFGEETLAWNPEYSIFGPTQAYVSPYKHIPVTITIEADGQVLWSGKRWAWGVVSDHHH